MVQLLHSAEKARGASNEWPVSKQLWDSRVCSVSTRTAPEVDPGMTRWLPSPELSGMKKSPLLVRTPANGRDAVSEKDAKHTKKGSVSRLEPVSPTRHVEADDEASGEDGAIAHLQHLVLPPTKQSGWVETIGGEMPASTNTVPRRHSSAQDRTTQAAESCARLTGLKYCRHMR